MENPGNSDGDKKAFWGNQPWRFFLDFGVSKTQFWLKAVRRRPIAGSLFLDLGCRRHRFGLKQCVAAGLQVLFSWIWGVGNTVLA